MRVLLIGGAVMGYTVLVGVLAYVLDRWCFQPQRRAMDARERAISQDVQRAMRRAAERVKRRNPKRSA